MKRSIYIFISVVMLSVACGKRDTGGNRLFPVPEEDVHTVSVDTMSMRNPFVVYDKKNDEYFMTGDGGSLWRSKDMRLWQGPYAVLQRDENSWIGKTPSVTSPEIHIYGKRYYYMATFTRNDMLTDTVASGAIPHRSCEIFVSDSLAGPYTHNTNGAPLLTATEEQDEHPTFCTDEQNVGYLIYNRNGEQNGDATVQIIRLGRNLNVQIGEPYKMFRAMQNNWSRAAVGQDAPSPIMEAPFLFDTDGRELGILFTTYIGDESVIGVAYTEKDHGLNGPWHIEPQPLVTGGVGGGMLFKDYDGTLVMALHKDTVINGTERSVPRFMKADSQFDKLKIKGYYKF